MLTKNRVNQVKWNQLIQNEEKFVLVKEFQFHSTCYVRNGNLLKSRVSEICVKRIRVNQGVGVLALQEYDWRHCSQGLIKDLMYFNGPT